MIIEDLQPALPPTPTIKLWTPRAISFLTFFIGFPSGITLASINWIRMGMTGKALAHIIGGIAGVLLLLILPENMGSLFGIVINIGYMTYLQQQMKRDIEKINNYSVQNAHWLGGILISLIGWGVAVVVILIVFLLQSLIPSTSSYYYTQGTFYFDKGDYKNAITNYNKAIELDPNDILSYNNRGLSYIYLGDYDRGIADCNKAIELDPNYADAYINRGIAYGNKGDYDKAIADFNKAITLNPNEPYSFYNRAFTYETLGNYEYALADYDKAIELNPEYIEAYVNRGLLHKSLGHTSDAIKDFEKILEISRDPNLRQQVEKELKKLKGQ